jgi:uncharacterized protein
MSLIGKLQKAILPGKVRGVQVGPYRTAVLVETESGLSCGLAATLSNPDQDRHSDPAVRKAGYLLEMDYLELTGLAESDSLTEVSIGLAAINALLPRAAGQWVNLNARDYLLQNCSGKDVAIIGHFPFVDQVKPCARHTWVLELHPRAGDLPAEAASEVLPEADFVAVTATTLINKTFHTLMPLCKPGATVILLGPSTPLSPVLYDFGVNILSGTIVDDPQFTLLSIGQGISIHQLHQSGHIHYITMIKGE